MPTATTRASVKDVARLAGVSVGTVSNVLNRPARVTPETRSKVEGAIAQLGFIPNAAARQLRVGAARTAGAIMLDLTNPFFMDVAQGLQDRLALDDWTLMVAASGGARDREEHFLRLYEEQGVQGVVVFRATDRADQLLALAERGVQVVLLDPAERVEGLSSVGVDDVAGGRMAAEHLLALGHESIALFNGPDTFHKAADRRSGFVSAVVAAGLDPVRVLREITVPMSPHGGVLGVQHLFALPDRDRPTAVFCVNDLVAIGALRTLHRAKVSIPGGLAVVGYDDAAFAAELIVPLTSVGRPTHALGSTAADLLLRPPGSPAEQIVYPPALVARPSTTG